MFIKNDMNPVSMSKERGSVHFDFFIFLILIKVSINEYITEKIKGITMSLIIEYLNDFLLKSKSINGHAINDKTNTPTNVNIKY